MRKIKVKLPENSYSILIGRNIIANIHNALKNLKLGNRPIIVTNPKINSIIGKRLKKILRLNYREVEDFIIADSERSKSLDTSIRLINFLVKQENLKNPFVIALGGGVVGDLAGFVASIYKRGIPYINVPTTLLSQVDSAIGGKVGVDLKDGKNLIGAFYQPRLVMIDLDLLNSLSLRHIKSGLSEVVKYGIISSPQLFEYLEENYRKILKLDPLHFEKIIYSSVIIKSRIVGKDEKEKRGLRTILNFGHTIGHAIEAATGYSGLYSHGEAISVGMICAVDISEKIGLCDKNTKARLEELLINLALPVEIKKVDARNILNSILLDKKFIHGKTRFVLPIRIGRVKVVEGISLRLIEEVVKNRSKE